MSEQKKGGPESRPRKSTTFHDKNTTEKEYVQGETFLLCATKKGGISLSTMQWEARQVLLYAARYPGGFQKLFLEEVDGTVLHALTIFNRPGGCVAIDAADAGTKLGADLVLAIESLGAGAKVRIERQGGGVA